MGFLSNEVSVMGQRLNLAVILHCILLFTVANRVTEVSGQEPAASWQWVLLRDRMVLEGFVAQQGSQITIQKGRSIVRLPAERVACWASSLAGLYQFQVDQRRQVSYAEHVALAQWCLHQGYSEGAELELQSARLLRPNDSILTILEQDLQRLRERRSTEVPKTAEKTLVSDQSADKPTADNEETISDHLLRRFTADIQPILANRCASAGCHAAGSESPFQLISGAGGSSRIDASSTKTNLRNVLQWIDRESPQASPVLVRATEIHGGSVSPPINLREQRLLMQLQRWVQAATAPTSRTDNHSRIVAGDENDEAAAVRRRLQTSTPVRLPSINDPFDPELFNRLFYGQQTP